MKKFYLCKLRLIVFGALLAVQSVIAKNHLLDRRIEFPAVDGPFPTVVLLHTAGVFCDVTDNIARYLKMGSIVVRPDYFGDLFWEKNTVGRELSDIKTSAELPAELV